MRYILVNAIIFIFTLIIMFFGIEGILRIKNSDMKNYNIEMWKYAKELKVNSNNPDLGHEHKNSAHATLQSVLIRTNNFGLRGADINENRENKRRILFLGSSATLGWGVKEEETMTSLLGEKLGENVEVLNAGIGNYNTSRYTELFFTKLEILHPTDIVIHYFLNDVEILKANPGNWFLRNSELAVTLWDLINRLNYKSFSIEEYYNNLYKKDNKGFNLMLNSLDKLNNYAKMNNINIYFVMTPDIHDITNYKFKNIHNIMKEIAIEKNFTYIDLLDSFENKYKSSELWVMTTDPHPNNKAHKIMVDAIYPYLINNNLNN